MRWAAGDTASCRELFRDLKRRGRTDPVLGATDGAPGLIRAFEEGWPKSLRQRCLAHKIRNLEGKMLADRWPEFKSQAWACYPAASPAPAGVLRDALVTAFKAGLPTAVARFADDFDGRIAHLRLPITHRNATRTTNLMERLFGEERSGAAPKPSPMPSGSGPS